MDTLTIIGIIAVILGIYLFGKSRGVKSITNKNDSNMQINQIKDIIEKESNSNTSIEEKAIKLKAYKDAYINVIKQSNNGKVQSPDDLIIEMKKSFELEMIRLHELNDEERNIILMQYAKDYLNNEYY